MSLCAQPADAYAKTKASTREAACQRWEEGVDAHVAAWVDRWFGEEAQARVAATIDSLTAPREG
jgi:hypothetical protein